MRRHLVGRVALGLVAAAVSVSAFTVTASAGERVPAAKRARGQERGAGEDARGSTTAKKLLAGVRDVRAGR